MPGLSVKSPDQYGSVMSAKSKRIIDHCIYLHLARDMSHVIEVAQWIRIIQVEGWGYNSSFQNFHAEGCFNGSCGPQHVSGGPFGGTNCELFSMLSKNTFDGLSFANVTLWSGGSMGVDVLNISGI